MKLPDELNDTMKYSFWSFILGLVVMYVLLTFALKDSQYYRGLSDGTFKLGRQLIIDLAKK